jgi:hypothetical protein
MDQARKQENHVAPLVHDRGVTIRTPDLAWQLVLDALIRRIVPLEIVVAICEVDVALVEDRRPLERRRCTRQSANASAPSSPPQP